MSTVLIFHGVGGNSEENWFPWLKKEIEKAGHRAIVPDFPNASHPNLDEWMKHVEKYEESIDEDSVFVGHSLGGAFALRMFERMKHHIKATYLVSSVWGVMENEFDPVMTTFNTKPYDWETIKKNAGKIHVIHADNDPYITLTKAEKLARNLGVQVELISGGGHLNASAGFTEFPQLRDALLPGLA